MIDCTDILIDDKSYQQQNDDLLFSSPLAVLFLFQVKFWTNCLRSSADGGVDDEMLEILTRKVPPITLMINEQHYDSNRSDTTTVVKNILQMTYNHVDSDLMPP